MPTDVLSIGDAARALGVSVDTIRRWDRSGRIATSRDGAGRRLVAVSEVERLRPPTSASLSARNHLAGRVESVEIDGLMAKVVLETTEPARVVALISREAALDLDLRAGDRASAVLKATSVMVER